MNEFDKLMANAVTFTIPAISNDDAARVIGAVDDRVELAAGNIGAASVLAHLSPDDVGHLKRLGIRGGEIWLAYKDFCKEDLSIFKASLCASDPGMIVYVKEVSGGARRRYELP
jgi:hypothetical protein